MKEKEDERSGEGISGCNGREGGGGGLEGGGIIFLREAEKREISHRPSFTVFFLFS